MDQVSSQETRGDRSVYQSKEEGLHCQATSQANTFASTHSQENSRKFRQVQEIYKS